MKTLMFVLMLMATTVNAQDVVWKLVDFNVHQIYGEADKSRNRLKYNFKSLNSVVLNVTDYFSVGTLVRYNDNNSSSAEGFIGIYSYFNFPTVVENVNVRIGYSRASRFNGSNKKYGMNVFTFECVTPVYKRLNLSLGASTEKYVSSREFNILAGFGFPLFMLD